MHQMGALRQLSPQDLQRYFSWPPAPLPPPPKNSSMPWVIILVCIFVVCPVLSVVGSLISLFLSNPVGAATLGVFVIVGIWLLIKYAPKGQRNSLGSPSPFPMGKQAPPPPPPVPTDEEYEAWVRSWRDAVRQYGMQKLRLDERNDVQVDKPLYVRSIVRPSSDDADYYESNDCPVLVKRGLDGRLHASVNRFTFFYPTEDCIAVFIGDVNALGAMRFERTRTYFYEDIVGVETSAFNLNDGFTSYVMQRFDLCISSGQSISAVTYVHDLNVEDTVQALRTLLKDKKQGGRRGY